MNLEEGYPTRISLIIELPRPIFQYQFYHLLKGNPTEYIDLWDGILRAVNGAESEDIAVLLYSIITLANDGLDDVSDPELNDFIDNVYRELDEMIRNVCTSLPPTDCIVYRSCDLYDDRTIILHGHWDREREEQ